LDLILFPYRVIVGNNSCHSTRSERFHSIVSRRPEITSKLSVMENRLRSIEHTLLASKRFAGSEALDRASPEAGEAGVEISTELIEALSDPDPGVRRLALGTINDFGLESAAAMIVPALHDPESSVRCAAAAAAAETGASAAVFSLILSLDDPALEVRRMAKLAIEKITDRKIDFDFSKDSSARRKKISSLKKWWEDERFASLAAEVEAVFRS
jgi:hypothetical protein